MSDRSTTPPLKRQKLDIEVDLDKSDLGNLNLHPSELYESLPGPSGAGVKDKYGNYVTPEELQKLREFKVLDEVKSNDEDSDDDDSDLSDDKSEGLPAEELEKMLEEDLPEGFKGVPKPKEKAYVVREKIILEDKSVNQFEVLPLDWLMVRHVSGIPLYVHRGTRVATLAKPYFLGKGNTRHHEIPISAIPCLAYRRALEEEEKQKEIDKKIAEQIADGTWANNTANATNTQNKSHDFSQDIEIEFSRNSQKNVSKLSQNHASAKSKRNDLIKEAQNKHKSSQNSTEKLNKISKCPFNREQSKNAKLNSDNIPKSNEIDSFNTITDKIKNEIDNDTNKSNDIQNFDQNNQLQSEKNRLGNKIEDNQSEITNNNTTEDDITTQEIPMNRRPVVLPGGIVMPPPRVETVNTSWKTQHLTAEQINNYCKKLFRFKTINIMHFKRWADRRKYTKARKTLQYPTLPEGTKLITIPAQSNNENGGKAKRDWVMNMNGSSYLSVFHEYVWRALHKQPVYEFKQLENASCPYQATVYIGGMRYGVGRGSSKRQAKSAAARASIHVLIPEMKDHLDHTHEGNMAEPDFSFFDYVGIEDPRIQEFCSATSEPSPHAILRTCLLRNFGAQDRHIQTDMKKLEYQKIELTMKVGKHSATVLCKNKKQAKQRASQAILQQLHPHIRSWGSLLRLYGSRSVKSCKEKKLEEQQITLLQDKARHNEPNYAVLEKLRNEMRKLRERDEAVVPIGTLLVAEGLPTHSGSNLNNVDL